MPWGYSILAQSLHGPPKAYSPYRALGIIGKLVTMINRIRQTSDRYRPMTKKNQLPVVVLCVFALVLCAFDGLAQKRKSKSRKSKTGHENQLPAATLISFKKNMFIHCGDSLSIDNHTLMITSVESDTTLCYFGNNEDVLWLYPATLVVKLNPARAIREIQILVNDNCRPGCSTANLYNRAGELIATASNTLSYEDELLPFTACQDATKLTITGYEGMFHHIKISYASP